MCAVAMLIPMSKTSTQPSHALTHHMPLCPIVPRPTHSHRGLRSALAGLRGEGPLVHVQLEALQPWPAEGDPTSPLTSSRADSEGEGGEGGRTLGLLSRWALRSRCVLGCVCWGVCAGLGVVLHVTRGCPFPPSTRVGFCLLLV